MKFNQESTESRTRKAVKRAAVAGLMLAGVVVLKEGTALADDDDCWTLNEPPVCYQDRTCVPPGSMQELPQYGSDISRYCLDEWNAPYYAGQAGYELVGCGCS